MMKKTNQIGTVNKGFLWEYKNEELIIQKSLKASNARMVFTKDQVERIINYIGDEGPAYIGNDLGKLASGREKEGIGLFIYENIMKDLPTAQYAGHLAAIFLEQNIIEIYGHKRDLTFILKRPDYIKNLEI